MNLSAYCWDTALPYVWAKKPVFSWVTWCACRAGMKQKGRWGKVVPEMQWGSPGKVSLQADVSVEGKDGWGQVTPFMRDVTSWWKSLYNLEKEIREAGFMLFFCLSDHESHLKERPWVNFVIKGCCLAFVKVIKYFLSSKESKFWKLQGAECSSVLWSPKRSKDFPKVPKSQA